LRKRSFIVAPRLCLRKQQMIQAAPLGLGRMAGSQPKAHPMQFP
jgi:hypothetical protein